MSEITDLSGKAYVTLDSNGRVSLPAKFREELTGKVVIGIDDNSGEESQEFPQLFIAAKEDLKQQYLDVLQVNGWAPNSAAGRQYADEFYSVIEDVTLDKNGRFVIPKEMYEHAKLQKEVDKDVVITGAGNRLIIRSVEVYEKQKAARPRVVAYK